MSVSIRLSRVGSKNHAFYRIVATLTRSKRDGKNLDILGSFNPKTKAFNVDKKLYDEWLKKGAVVSPAVKKLIEK
jgi:small subunit ribosomal protein S16